MPSIWRTSDLTWTPPGGFEELPSPTSQQNPGLLYALFHKSFTHIHCAKYPAANGEAIELVALVDEKGAFFWKAHGMLLQGCVLALTGTASDAVQMISFGITAFRATGTASLMTAYLSYLARGPRGTRPIR